MTEEEFYKFIMKMDEDQFHRRWRPDWNEIENPDNNDRRI